MVVLSACGSQQPGVLEIGSPAAIESMTTIVAVDEPPVPDPVVDVITVDPADSDVVAVRVAPPDHQAVVDTAAPSVGLFGLPFAPEGITDCEEMEFYRVQAGLPDRFQSLGYRESNCRNEAGVRTFCCYGYWQLYFTMHFADSQGWWAYVACEIDEVSDYNGDEPLDKQKQACAAKGIFDVVGYSAWAL